MTAELGFGDLFEPDCPTPFQVDLSGARQPIAGFLEVSVPSDPGVTGFAPGETRYQIPVSISPGATKRWRLVLPSLTGNSVKVRLTDRDQRLLDEQEFFATRLKAWESLVLIVQENVPPRFAMTRRPGGALGEDFRTASLPPELLPENPLAYSGVGAVLWRSDKRSPLNPAQSRALAAWLRIGGILVVAGGQTVAPNLAPDFPWPMQWADFRDVELQMLKDATLQPPHRLLCMAYRPVKSKWRCANVLAARISVRPLRGGDGRVRLEAAGHRLITEGRVGAGVVIQLAFDPIAFQGAGAALDYDFWRETLCMPQLRRLGWSGMEQHFKWLVLDPDQSMLAEAADYRVTSLATVSGVFWTFVGIAFCLNFWLFRKSRRYEWACASFALASVGLLAWNVSFGRVGGDDPTRHAEITWSYGLAGEREFLHLTHAGLLAPRSRSEFLAARQPDQILLGADSEIRHILVEPDGLRYPFRTKPGAFVTCQSICVDSLAGDGIAASWEQGPDQDLRIVLENKTGLRLGSYSMYPWIMRNSYKARQEGNRVILAISLEEAAARAVRNFGRPATGETDAGPVFLRVPGGKWIRITEKALSVVAEAVIQFHLTDDPRTQCRSAAGQSVHRHTVWQNLPISVELSADPSEIAPPPAAGSIPPKR